MQLSKQKKAVAQEQQYLHLTVAVDRLGHLGKNNNNNSEKSI